MTVSSMCTVFAESEVVDLVHRGEDGARIALGVHEAIVRRVVGTLKRVGAAPPLLVAGGVARKGAVRRLTERSFGGAVLVADEPPTRVATRAGRLLATLRGPASPLLDTNICSC